MRSTTLVNLLHITQHLHVLSTAKGVDLQYHGFCRRTGDLFNPSLLDGTGNLENGFLLAVVSPEETYAASWKP